MLQASTVVSSLSGTPDNQSSAAVGNHKQQQQHRLSDIQSMLAALQDQQPSKLEVEDIIADSDMNYIRNSFTHGARPRSLTLPSSSLNIDTDDVHPTGHGHGRSRSVSVSPATYQPTSTSDFPSPPSTPPTEETESNARFDRIFNLLNGLIGEGKEALESEGADILQRKPSQASLRHHSRGNSISEAGPRPRSHSSGRSSRLSMRSDGSSDEGESFRSSTSQHASVESDEESEFSEFSDNSGGSSNHSRSSSLSDSEANGKVEAFRRSLNELDRVDGIAGLDAEEGFEDVEEENNDNSAQFSPIQAHSPKHPSQHHVEVAEEWDDDDPPLSAYMDSPSRNSGRDLSAENPLLQSIKRVDTNLQQIERLSLELFHDEDELPYDEDDLDDGEIGVADRFTESPEAIAIREKSLASMRSTLRRNLARLLLDSLTFILAHLIFSPWLMDLTQQRVVIAFGLVIAVVNQLNRYSRVAWRADSTEMPGFYYSADASCQSVPQSFGYEHAGLYKGLSMHLSNTTKDTYGLPVSKYRYPVAAPFMPLYAKAQHVNPTSALITPPESPQYTLQHNPLRSSRRNSFIFNKNAHHHHHHHHHQHRFTCDGCLQKLEVVMEQAEPEYLGRYEGEMPRMGRRMSV